jgi:chromosome segregation ATPase
MKPLRKCPPCECGCDTCDIGLATLEIDCNKATIKVTCDCRTYAHERRAHDALNTRLSEQDRKAAELERKSADITRRVEELEKLRREIEYSLQILQSAGARVDDLESRLHSFALTDRVRELEQEIGLRATEDRVAALERDIGTRAYEDRVTALEQDVNKRAYEDRVQTLEQSVRGQASESAKITALEGKIELLNSQLMTLFQRKPSQRGTPPANP